MTPIAELTRAKRRRAVSLPALASLLELPLVSGGLIREGVLDGSRTIVIGRSIRAFACLKCEPLPGFRHRRVNGQRRTAVQATVDVRGPTDSKRRIGWRVLVRVRRGSVAG